MKNKRRLVASILLVMRITFVQIAFSVVFVSSLYAKEANGQSILDKPFTISVENMQLKKVISSIQKQTKVKFTFSTNVINAERVITYSAQEKKILDFLNEVLKPCHINYRVVDNQIILFPANVETPADNNSAVDIKTIKPDKTVSGTVTNDKGEPVPGVTVTEKNKTNAVITDEKGYYSIRLTNDNAILVFTSIGYESQEASVAGLLSLNIILKTSNKALDEVVVVGYGIQKRSDITGSVASVPKDRLSKLPVNNVMQAIQGSVANVTVTQSSSIPGDVASTQIRGRNSINATNEPYIVVDGIPLSNTDGSINDINPNDVESVEILKDPSAVAVYGVKGSNGVILITTKRGNTSKPTIKYNMYAGVEEAAHIVEGVSGEELVNRYKEYARITNTTLYQGGPMRNQYEAENYAKGTTIDWIDAVMQTGVVQNHNIGVSGGSENAKYYMSLDYLNQKGILKGYNYKRYSFRANTDLKVTRYLTVGTSSYIISHNRDGGRANLLMATAMTPYARMYDSSGTLTRYPMYSETLFTNPLLNTTLDPERRVFNVTLNGYGELNLGELLKPLKGLRYKFNGGFTYVPTRTNEYEGESVYNSSGWGRISNSESQTYTLENILTYTKDFGKHHVDFTGLYAAKQKYWQEAVATGQVFPNDDLTWGNLESASTQSVSSQADKYNSTSQMGRLNYGYDSRYLFTFTVRRDGASVFGKNNKFGTFPSAAVAWNIHNESFMENLSHIVSSLKLRVSYGVSGNEAIPIYSTLALMSSGSLAMNNTSQTALQVNSRMGNDDLRWEKTAGFNTGIDFSLWKNRLSGTVEFYKTNTVDMLLLQNIPRITGYADVWTNIGKVDNIGMEATLNSKNIVTKNFAWSSTLVFSSNKNKIVDVYGNGKSDVGNRWFIGQPISVIYDYTKVGIWQTDEIASGANAGWDAPAQAGDLKLADLNKDGKVDDNDRTVLGQTTPKWTAGLTNTITYRDFSLSFFITTVQGVLRNNSQLAVASDEMGRRNVPAAIGYWTPENKSNEWRSLGNHSNSHGYGFPVDGDYTRLKDLTISYNIPKPVASKIGLGGILVYASGRNLYTWSNWLGWDPEARDITRGSANDNLNYPVVRSYVLGVNVTF